MENANAEGAKVAVTNAAENAKEAVSNATDKLKSFASNKQSLIITLLIVGAISLVVAIVLKYMVNSIILSKKDYLVPGTSAPIMGTVLTKTPIQSPALSNGQRASISFWVYVHDIDKFKGTLRHVLHVGDEAMENGSPSVFFDSSTNQMLVVFSPRNAPTKSPDTSVEAHVKGLLRTSGIAIDYIPIQRWVHIAIVVNENVNGGTMYAYVDAELVKTVATGESDINIQKLNLSKGGNIYLGGSTSDNIGPGFSGLLSKVKLYNYDLNVGDVYSEYKSGPINNLLAKLGLPAYGIQSPVYRIG